MEKYKEVKKLLSEVKEIVFFLQDEHPDISSYEAWDLGLRIMSLVDQE